MYSSVEYDGFYDASRARQIAMGQSAGNSDVLNEINALQSAIDTAAAGSNLEAIIVGTTTMTASASFFASWNDPFNNETSTDKLNRAKMDAVVNYFSRLGYTIKRSRVGVTDAFQWTITW